MERQLSMARLGERHGQTETAHKIYQKVLLQDPDNVEALHRLGVMAAKTQDYETSIAYLTKAEMNDPSNVELLNDLGYALFLTDDLLGAEEKLQLAIRLKPGHRAARNNLGLLLGNAGRWDECIVQFKRAVSEAEAYANLAFVQVQMGEFALAEKSFHSALDLDEELDAAAEGLVQIQAKKNMLEKRFIADFNEQATKRSLEHQTVEQVATVIQPASPRTTPQMPQTPSVVATQPETTINLPIPTEAVPSRIENPAVIAATPIAAEPVFTPQIQPGTVNRANRQLDYEQKSPFQPRLRQESVAQQPVSQTTTIEIETPAVVETPVIVETPVVVETPAVIEPPTEILAPVQIEPPVLVEKPVENQKPVEIEIPAVVDTPVEIHTPVEIETPMVVVTPAEIPASAQVETPVLVEKPVEMQKPVEIEIPAVVDTPVEVHTPVEIEAPAVVEPAVQIQAPVEIATPTLIEKPVAIQKPIEIERGPLAPLPEPTVFRTAFNAESAKMPVPVSQASTVKTLGSPLSKTVSYDLPEITSETVIHELPVVIRKPLPTPSSELAPHPLATTNLETNLVPVQVKSVKSPIEPTAHEIEEVHISLKTAPAAESPIITAAQPTRLNGQARAAKVEPVHVVPVDVREIEVREIEVAPVKVEPVNVKIPSSLQPVTIKPVTPQLETKESMKAKPIPRPSIWD